MAVLVWARAQRYNYQGSGWISVRDQRLVDRPDDADHIAYQAVVAFPDGLTARDFYDSQVTEWAKCDYRRVDLHDAGDPNAHYWSLTEATDNDGIPHDHPGRRRKHSRPVMSASADRRE